MGSVERCMTEEKVESILVMKGEKEKCNTKRDIVIRGWCEWNGMERCAIVSLVVSDHCCNESECDVLDLGEFVNLLELRIGNECFEKVNELKLIGLSTFERVVIGESCFTRIKNSYGYGPNRHCYIKNCHSLREVKFGCFAFSDATVCEIDNVNALEVIEMGDVCFFSSSLELRGSLLLKWSYS